MTGLPDNNSGNDFIRGLETRACINGMTKSDVERLKNALVKKILDDETVIEITEDGGIVADSDGLFIKLNGQQLGLSVDGEDIIPVTEPYLPEDDYENPLAPPNDTIMTSANIAVDPRIVHTIGNETITGNKTFTGLTFIDQPRFKRSNQTIHGNGEWVKFYEFKPVTNGGCSVIRAFQIYYIYSWINAEIRLRQGANIDGKFFNFTGIAGKLAKRTSDDVVEVWLQTTGTSSLGVVLDIVLESGINMKVASGVSETAPVVGDTYSTVVDIATS